MPLDLTRLRPRLDNLLLVDSCEIWRDVEGSLDDVTDPVTGSVTGPAPDATLVYNGQAGLRHVLHGMMLTESGAGVVVGEYEVKVPAGTSVRPGDLLKFTATSHDALLLGKWMRIRELLHSSLTIFTKFRAELRERASDRP